MSVEYLYGTPEYGQQPNSLLEYKPPAQLIEESHDARRVFADFMWRYVGDASPWERARGGFPPIEREAVDGTRLYFTEQRYSGYSNLDANLVHVRIDPSQDDQLKKFFVVTGSLAAEAYERTVFHVDNKWNVKNGLETTLYLADPDYEHLPLEYQSQIRMPQDRAIYYPGGQNLAEQLHPIERLHSAALGRLALVQDIVPVAQ